MARPFDLITFDFDGVLLHNNYNDLFLDHSRTLGLAWEPQQERVLARFIHDYFGSGRSRTDFEAHGAEGFWAVAYAHFLETLGAQGDVAVAATALAEAMQAAEGVYYHEFGLHEMLEGLREQGYHLAMLTNRDDQIHEFGNEWELIAPFEFIGTRDTVGKPKPEPHLYHHIAEHFNVPAARALHIGDNPYADVVGAQAAGWHVVLIDPDDLFPDWDVPRLPSLRDLPEWLDSQ